MIIKCWMKGHRDNYYAKGIYQNGAMTVLKGSKVFPIITEKARIIESAKAARDDKSLLDENFCTKKDMFFSSPTAAAQFVRGNIINGNRCWKIDDKKETLGKYIKFNKCY